MNAAPCDISTWWGHTHAPVALLRQSSLCLRRRAAVGRFLHRSVEHFSQRHICCHGNNREQAAPLLHEETQQSVALTLRLTFDLLGLPLADGGVDQIRTGHPPVMAFAALLAEPGAGQGTQTCRVCFCLLEQPAGERVTHTSAFIVLTSPVDRQFRARDFQTS